MSASVIAIDGPAYVGKSQIAQAVAKKLGYEFINTGHMYRALARRALELGVNMADESGLLAMPFDVWFVGGNTLVSEGADRGVAFDWTNGLDRVEIVESAGKIANLPAVRDRLTRIQRSYLKRPVTGVVMEGRDIGTVVFPDADWKFFITASEKIRAERLLKMASAQERESMDFQKAFEKILQIDAADQNRKIAPLRQAKDAFLYDNSESPSAAEDAEEILNCIKLGKQQAPKAFTYGIHR